ncbi:allophanate hydrolase [Acidimangrovimonas sediminis]|uniref:allophanate hydrolase n=1 Tax=Acidimangrovimonas sediminis TaxID=2056283 RepID=UPI000C80A9D8|nr:allophanate hydrolase [Acidimangrovimonas sediminis]
MTEDLSDLSLDIQTLHAAYAAGLRPEEVMAEVFRRIDRRDDPGIFLHLRAAGEVAAEAAALGPFDPETRPLWGLPFAIKDNIDLGGVPTTAACPDFAYLPKVDAFAVAALRAAGAVPVGKTNLDQLATGLVGVRTPFPVPRNAVDPEIVPGGSSSGSGVSVAAGLVSFALGTDTAGSGRVPAALNNIVGLKPSLGALSSTGVVPACRTLDTISVFALTVADAWAVTRAAAVYDAADAYARPLCAPPMGAVPPGIAIGVPDARSRIFFGDTAQAESFAAGLGRLKALGARIEEVDFTPFYDVAEMLYEGAWVAERMTVAEDLMRRKPEALHPVTRQIIGAAEGLSAADAFRGIYRLAELKRVVEPVLSRFDMLCVPTIPTFYTLDDLEADPVGPNSRLGTYTNFVNLLDLCGLAVPTGPRVDGRPGSLTLLGRAGGDAALATLGAALQAAGGARLGATGLPQPAAPEPRPAAMPGEMVIAAVGAHMSGLPLNHQLTDRGGRYLETTETAPEYRLSLLAGGPPLRPGLLRVAEGGAAIALELWALPLAEVGSFLVGIPSPLGLGTVVLADGRKVQGFLVEAAGLTGAQDITRHGGWRGYLQAAQGQLSGATA